MYYYKRITWPFLSPRNGYLDRSSVPEQYRLHMPVETAAEFDKRAKGCHVVEYRATTFQRGRRRSFTFFSHLEVKGYRIKIGSEITTVFLLSSVYLFQRTTVKIKFTRIYHRRKKILDRESYVFLFYIYICINQYAS